MLHGPMLFVIAHVIYALVNIVDGGINVCSMHLEILHLKSRKTTHTGYSIALLAGLLCLSCLREKR